MEEARVQALHQAARAALEMLTPLVYVVVAMFLLVVSSDDGVLFGLVLAQGALLVLVFLLCAANQLLPVTLAWYFWVLYSVGYHSRGVYLDDGTMVFVTQLVLTIGLHGGAVAVSFKPGGALKGCYLLCLLFLVIFDDLVPLEENSLFRGVFLSFVRLGALFVIHCVGTYRSRIYKHSGNPKEAILRGILQLQYTLFGNFFAMLVIFILHVCLECVSIARYHKRAPEEATDA